jgi:WD40 repeat protein
MTALVFSPDGKLLASAIGDMGGIFGVGSLKPGEKARPGEIKIWDLSAGKELRTLAAHTGGVHALAFSPDGKRLASAGRDRTVTLWDLATGRQLQTLAGAQMMVRSLAFHPDGKRLASGGGEAFLVFNAPGELLVWDVETRKKLVSLRGHTAPVTHTVFSPDGGRLLSASADATVRVRQLDTGQEQVLRGHTDEVLALAVAADGKTVASAGKDHAVRIWDITRDPEAVILPGVTEEELSRLFSSDGRRVVLESAPSDPKAPTAWKVWDVGSGKELLELKDSSTLDVVIFAPVGDLVASVNDAGTVQVWDSKTGKRLRTLKGANAPVIVLGFSADATLLAAGSKDKTVHIWDVASGKIVRTFRGLAVEVDSVRFSRDGRWLAAGASRQWKTGIEGRAFVWNVADGKEILSTRGDPSLDMSLEFSADSSLFAFPSEDAVRIWQLPSGRLLHTLAGLGESVNAVRFSPDGTQLATASGRQVKLWDPRSGRLVATFQGHTGEVQFLSFHPAGRRLASVGFDDRTSAIKIWDVHTGQETLSFHHPGMAMAAFTPDGNRLAISGILNDYQEELRLCDASPSPEPMSLMGPFERVAGVAVSAHGLVAAVGGQPLPYSLKKHAPRGVATSPAKNLPKEPVPVPKKRSPKPKPPAPKKLPIAGDLKTPPPRAPSLVPAEISKSVGAGMLWDANGQETASLIGHEGGIYALAFHPDKKRLATGSADHSVRLWDATTGKQLRSLTGHLGLVTSVAFAPDGKWLASAGTDQAIRIWDPDTGKELHTLRGLLPVRCLAFSPSGRHLASGSGAYLDFLSWPSVDRWGIEGDVPPARPPIPPPKKTWLEKGGPPLAHTGNPLSYVALGPPPSPDKVAVPALTLWETASWKEVKTLRGHKADINSVVFTPDGQRLLTASSDRTLKIWDSGAGNDIATLAGHEGLVSSLAVSNDGRYFASGSWDHTIKIWDARSGKELLTLRAHTSMVTAVAVIPDGKRLISGAMDGTVKIWDLDLLLAQRPRNQAATRPARDSRQQLLREGANPDYDGAAVYRP